MAKKSGGPNKSQAIRDYYGAHPDAKPKDIAVELKKMGIDVTPAFISTIRSTTMGGAKKKKTTKSASTKTPAKVVQKRGPKPKGSSPSAPVSIDSLIKAKSLVKDLGGIDNAIATLTALKRLAD